MHILYIHQYFATPNGSVGTRSHEFARRWVEAGHRVTMLTSTAQLTPADIGNQPWPFITRKKIDGIEVVAVNVRYHQSMGFLRRMLAFVYFMLAACWLALRAKNVDVVFATSTPLTIGIPALLSRRLRGRRFVFEVRDPWPAVPIALGILRSRLLIWMARTLERMIYRRAEAVIALSPGMADEVRKVIGDTIAVHMVSNCADTDTFRSDIDGDGVRHARVWNGKFVCLHAGAMGRLNGLDLLVRAAEHFRHEPEFHFVLVGDGSERAALMAEKERRSLSNLEIVGRIPKQEIPSYLAAADVCVVLFNLPVFEYNSANKFFDYLSSGRPVLLNYSGWQREALETYQAGIGCRMGDDGEFFSRLRELKESPLRREAMGRNARRLAEELFDRDQSARKVLEVLLYAAKGNPTC